MDNSQAKVEIPFPSKYGNFKLYAYQVGDLCHIALVLGTINTKSSTLVRLHSKCLTGEVLGSLKCDCGFQLEYSLEMISTNKNGILIYLDQEGRGIGLFEKLKAYRLQDQQQLDTAEANLALGHPIDSRNYELAGKILQSLCITDITLLTNNPEKINALTDLGFKVEHKPIPLEASLHNIEYLKTKINKFNHEIKITNLDQILKCDDK